MKNSCDPMNVVDEMRKVSCSSTSATSVAHPAISRHRPPDAPAQQVAITGGGSRTCISFISYLGAACSTPWRSAKCSPLRRCRPSWSASRRLKAAKGDAAAGQLRRRCDELRWRACQDRASGGAAIAQTMWGPVCRRAGKRRGVPGSIWKCCGAAAERGDSLAT